MMGAKQDRLT